MGGVFWPMFTSQICTKQKAGDPGQITPPASPQFSFLQNGVWATVDSKAEVWCSIVAHTERAGCQEHLYSESSFNIICLSPCPFHKAGN